MRTRQFKIVVAEDHSEQQKSLVAFLRKNEFNAMGVSTGVELERVIAQQQVDVVLLNTGAMGNVGMPKGRRQQERQGPHLVVLSPNDNDEDRILAFEAGADNYLLTPVNPRLLLALLSRIHARLSIASWRLQPSKRNLHTPAGNAAALTGPEVSLLETLARANGRTVPRRQLIEALGHEFLSYDERRLEVGISRLRKKIKDETGIDAPLKSGRGVGYAFTEPCVLI
jgi:two-component system, OmpR family, response regulator